MFEFCNRLSVGRTASLFWNADVPLDRFAIPAFLSHFSLLIFLFYMVLPLKGELERVYLLTFLVLTVGPPDEDLLFPPLLLTLPPFWAPAFPLSFTIVRTQRKPI